MRSCDLLLPLPQQTVPGRRNVQRRASPEDAIRDEEQMKCKDRRYDRDPIVPSNGTPATQHLSRKNCHKGDTFLKDRFLGRRPLQKERGSPVRGDDARRPGPHDRTRLRPARAGATCPATNPEDKKPELQGQATGAKNGTRGQHKAPVSPTRPTNATKAMKAHTPKDNDRDCQKTSTHIFEHLSGAFPGCLPG